MTTILHGATAVFLMLLVLYAVKEWLEDREVRRRIKKMKRDIDRVAEDTRHGIEKINELKRKENEIHLD